MISLVVEDEQLQLVLSIAVVLEGRSQCERNEVGHLSRRETDAIEREERNHTAVGRFVRRTDAVDVDPSVFVGVQKPELSSSFG